MAQKLYTDTIVDGKEEVKEVEVIRSWGDASGKFIYLHLGGYYGYKDGTPLVSSEDFELIKDKVQREAAMSWWKRIGKAESEAYYNQIEEDHRARTGDFNEEVPPESNLDNILYSRYPSGSERPEKAEPSPWPEFFTNRPDWWGQAKFIEFNDWMYERFDEKNIAEPPPETEKTAKTPEKVESKDSKTDGPPLEKTDDLTAPDTQGPTGPGGGTELEQTGF